ncbi:MAG TPA: hypothetical protein PKK23_05635 [Nitrospirales bacterium]|nr:hypothetical protein [Nitrospiraceae bacterium]HNP28504.1 hypothetical protein [Nitrospirales bacterium]
MRQFIETEHEKFVGLINSKIRTHTDPQKAVGFACALIITLLTSPFLAAGENNELPFKAASIIFETTDNDIELQVFVDGNQWKTLKIDDLEGGRSLT